MKIQNISQAQYFKSADKQEKKEKFNPLVAAGGLLGAMLPVLAISKVKNGKLNFDVFEYEGKAGKLKELASILTVGAGGILGGLAGGVLSTKDKEDRKEKVKEAVFDYSTILIPTTITTALIMASKKLKAPNIVEKAGSSILGIGLGMPLAQKFADKVDKKFIHKDKADEPQRKLKWTDYLVHIDDIFTLIILTKIKIPFIKEGFAEKILPFIYAWCGYETGTAESKKSESEPLASFKQMQNNAQSANKKYIMN